MEDRSEGIMEVEVITTLANGKEEFPYASGEIKIVEGVPVRYFKRWTKDHSHFSPALLWHLWKKLKLLTSFIFILGGIFEDWQRIDFHHQRN